MIPGVPEEIPAWVHSTRDARHWLACAFRAQGYTVTEDPGPDDLPETLWDYHMDLLATRGAEHVAAVVRRRNDISDNTVALAALLKTLPGWRFDMIVLPVSALASAPNRAPVLAAVGS